MTGSMGISSDDAQREILLASGLPVPFSIRDKVEAETPVWSATSRRLKPCCSRRRRTAPPSSDVSTPDFFAMSQSLPLMSFSCKTLFYRRNRIVRQTPGRSDQVGDGTFGNIAQRVVHVNLGPKGRHLIATP